MRCMGRPTIATQKSPVFLMRSRGDPQHKIGLTIGPAAEADGKRHCQVGSFGNLDPAAASQVGTPEVRTFATQVGTVLSSFKLGSFG